MRAGEDIRQGGLSRYSVATVHFHAQFLAGMAEDVTLKGGTTTEWREQRGERLGTTQKKQRKGGLIAQRNKQARNS